MDTWSHRQNHHESIRRTAKKESKNLNKQQYSWMTPLFKESVDIRCGRSSSSCKYLLKTKLEDGSQTLSKSSSVRYWMQTAWRGLAWYCCCTLQQRITRANLNWCCLSIILALDEYLSNGLPLVTEPDKIILLRISVTTPCKKINM